MRLSSLRVYHVAVRQCWKTASSLTCLIVRLDVGLEVRWGCHLEQLHMASVLIPQSMMIEMLERKRDKQKHLSFLS